MASGVELIATERARQVADEGWDAAHDAQYTRGELTAAAACYVHAANIAIERFGNPASWDLTTARAYQSVPPPRSWPFDPKWWKPKDPIRDLVRGAALAAAEIDRLRALTH